MGLGVDRFLWVVGVSKAVCRRRGRHELSDALGARRGSRLGIA